MVTKKEFAEAALEIVLECADLALSIIKPDPGTLAVSGFKCIYKVRKTVKDYFLKHQKDFEFTEDYAGLSYSSKYEEIARRNRISKLKNLAGIRRHFNVSVMEAPPKDFEDWKSTRRVFSSDKELLRLIRESREFREYPYDLKTLLRG